MPAGIAIDHVFTRRCRFFYPLRVEIQRHKRDIFLLQETRQILPAAPITADDHVLLLCHGLHRDVMQLHSAVHPLRAAEMQHQVFASLDDERRSKHRKQHGGENHLHYCRVEQVQACRLPQQHETKFPGLRKAQCGAQCNPRLAAEHAAQARDQENLQQHQRREQAAHRKPVLQHNPDI